MSSLPRKTVRWLRFHWWASLDMASLEASLAARFRDLVNGKSKYYVCIYKPLNNREVPVTNYAFIKQLALHLEERKRAENRS